MITIVAPVYNVEKYLKKFIESIVNQTYEDFELLLVTDCPTDNSLSICEDYQSKDKRIKIIRQERNGGVAKARNKGLKEAKGDYIMLADSDDYLPNDALKTLKDLIDNNNADMAMGGFYLDIEGEIKRKKFKAFRKIYNHKEAAKCHLNFHTLYGYPWGKLFKREVLENVVDPEDMSSGDDGVFSFYALMNATSVAFTDHPVYYYRIRRDSLSGHGGNFSTRDLDVFRQIEYVKSRLKNEKEFDNDFKVFCFGLLCGAINKYNNSSNEVKSQFKDRYDEMKKICDENCNTVILKSSNPKMKIKAIKYKMK